MDKLLKALEEGTCIVTYEKIEGHDTGKLRDMVCTLNSDIIPSHIHIKQRANSDHILVWCIDRNDWRSVRTSTITKWEKNEV